MSEEHPFDPVPALAEALRLPPEKVSAVVHLLAEGNTVPFIARYRKEATGGLDEVQIRSIEERREYLVALDARRHTILASIGEQGKLTDELRARLLACRTKAELEDLYLPFKPKRRTRATVARERGLEPLAGRILEQPLEGDPASEAAAFVDPAKEIPDADAALAGARDIVAEAASERADLRAFVRETFAREGVIVAAVVPERAGERTKYEQYYAFRERVRDIPSHRFLALRRGEREGILKVGLEVEEAPLLARIEGEMGVRADSPFAPHLREAIADGYRRLLAPSIENDVRGGLKEHSDLAAVEVFASNLRNLLLTPPLGSQSVVGIDPGIRTGCKCAAVDATGKYLDTLTIFPSKGEEEARKARETLVEFVRRLAPAAIAVGNGTGGRETEAFVRGVLREEGLGEVIVAQVNEAGASVYSASPFARQELPDLDVTVRGAVSIARRLQDPLAELVKIDPRSIGVGQYQHDVHAPLLRRKLGDVVESCVNHVGVELNTASVPLLARVAGIGQALAKKIVGHRDATGGFGTREALHDVPGLGKKAFEQAAGFLRIRGGGHPLDASAVHPERYALVARIASDLGVELASLVGNPDLARSIDVMRYVDETVGEPTLYDIIAELEKPGRDPRSTFEPPPFREDITEISHLEPGMWLEGVVTNVTAFGAFVDVGVHQDGLVHISQLADRFVKDPHEVVKVGDRIRVRVLEVDLERKRIGLAARSEAPLKAPKTRRPRKRRRADGAPREARQDSREPGADAAKATGGEAKRRERKAPAESEPPRKISVEEAVRRLGSRFNTRP